MPPNAAKCRKIPQCLKITEKVSFNIASYGATFTFWVDKSSLEMPKKVNFGEFLKTWSFWSNSVTRQDKNWWKMPKLKNSKTTFELTKVHQKCQKWSMLASILAIFWKPEGFSQTVLPDRLILIGQKCVENAKIEKL